MRHNPNGKRSAEGAEGRNGDKNGVALAGLLPCKPFEGFALPDPPPEFQLYEVLAKLPKVDLHRHLEGSLRLKTLVEIARRDGLPLPQDERALSNQVQVQRDDERTSPLFLSKFETLREFYRSPEIIRRITREVIEDAAEDGVRYLELRFTPVTLIRSGGFTLEEVVEWVVETALKEAADYGMGLGLILSINRHDSITSAERAAQVAVDWRDRGIAGLDLAGDESNYPADGFTQIFASVREAGLGTTAHAGEWSGAESVRFAMEQLGADRIGHGVRVLEDIEIVRQARERRVVFEVCLTSNYHSGVVSQMSDHPLPRMIEAGLQVTLNSDDPGISNIRLSDEHLTATEELGLSIETLKGLTLVAAQAAFLPLRAKRELEAELQASLGLS